MWSEEEGYGGGKTGGGRVVYSRVAASGRRLCFSSRTERILSFSRRSAGRADGRGSDLNASPLGRHGGDRSGEPEGGDLAQGLRERVHVRGQVDPLRRRRDPDAPGRRERRLRRARSHALDARGPTQGRRVARPPTTSTRCTRGALVLQEQAERAEAKGADASRRSDLLAKACARYDAAHRCRPRSHSTLYNWGIALGDRARMSADAPTARQLWGEACDKYRAAVECDVAKTQSTQALNNWGLALQQLATVSRERDEKRRRLLAAVGRFREAIRRDPSFHRAVYNLGTIMYALSEMARKHRGEGGGGGPGGRGVGGRETRTADAEDDDSDSERGPRTTPTTARTTADPTPAATTRTASARSPRREPPPRFRPRRRRTYAARKPPPARGGRCTRRRSGAFYTLVPIRPRSRGERRSLRTLPAHLSAHPSLSIPALDAFQLQLTPFNSTPTFACMERPSGSSALHHAPPLEPGTLLAVVARATASVRARARAEGRVGHEAFGRAAGAATPTSRARRRRRRSAAAIAPLGSWASRPAPTPRRLADGGPRATRRAAVDTPGASGRMTVGRRT